MLRQNTTHHVRAPAAGTVTRSLQVPALAALLAATLSACHEKHGCCYDVVCPVPPGVTAVSPASVTLAPGDTARFVALVSGSLVDPCNADAKPMSRAVTWTVSDASVASIVATPDSTTVKVRGVAAGHASVIAAAVADTLVKAAGLLIVK